MRDPRAICETCGHTRQWHDGAGIQSDPPVDRPCKREVGGAACRCGGFRESGIFAMPGSAPTQDTAPGSEIVRVGALALLLVVLALALLYAYRSQTPSIPEVDAGQAVQDINSGRVRAVAVAANKATLEFNDSDRHREQTTVPEPDTVLAPAVASYNTTHQSQPVQLRYTQDGQPFGAVGAILLILLPVLLIAGFFYYAMGIRRRSR